MQCPVDGATLTMSERQGVEIDYCPQCRGVWLDRGELDKILERAASEMGRAQVVPAHDYSRGEPKYRGGHAGYPQHKRRKSFLEELFD